MPLDGAFLSLSKKKTNEELSLGSRHAPLSLSLGSPLLAISRFPLRTKESVFHRHALLRQPCRIPKAAT